MRLAELQSALHAALEGTPSPELQPFIGSRRLSPDGCIDLYRQLLRKARLGALRRFYPVTGLLLGPGHFESLTDLYSEQIAAGASSSPFGEMLPALLDKYRARTPELSTLPFLTELALLEWQLHCARNAPDDPEIDFEAWAHLPHNQQLRMCPVASRSLSLQRYRWPVSAIRDALLKGQAWQPARGQRGGWHCIHRHLGQLCIEAVSDEQARLISGILKGHSLYQLSCDVPSVQDQLALMVARGWICGLQPAAGDQAI